MTHASTGRMGQEQRFKGYRPLILALGIGLLGGLVFALMGLPLAWMLGSMTVCGLASMAGLPVAISPKIRPPMSAVIGAMLGTQFGPHTFESAAHWWPALVGLAAYLLVAATLCYFYLVRVVRLDPITGYFSAMPGGLIDMVLLGAERGGDERTIALMHSSRIFLVVLSLPLLITLVTGVDPATQSAAYRPLGDLELMDIGWFFLAAAGGVVIGRLIRLPAPYLIGPMLGSTALHTFGMTTFVVPTMAIAVAQVVLGATVGCRFSGTPPRRILWILVTSAGSTIILLTVCLIFALLLQDVLEVPVEGIVLAFSPGGLAEMSLIALALNLEVSFVVICHMSRIALVIIGAVFLMRFRKG